MDMSDANCDTTAFIASLGKVLQTNLNNIETTHGTAVLQISAS